MSNDRGSCWNYSNWGPGSSRGYGRGRGSHRGRGNGEVWRGMKKTYRSDFRGHTGFRENRGGYGNRPDQPWRNRPKRDTPGKRLSEEEIGVTEYVSDHEGFLGIIKSRYSDFQVAEINEDGEVAKLTDLKPPVPQAEEAVVEDEDLLLCKYNLEILPMKTWDSINKLAVLQEETSEKVEVNVTGMSKEQRTKIHDAVKKAFGDSIVGSTVTIDDKKLVRFEKYRKGVRIDNRVKWAWPGEYLYFIVHKENCDTMEAASRIAERLRLNVKPSMLGYAGTKDRRAKTSQWFSLRRIDPRRVASACKGLRDVRIGNYSFRTNNLRLGNLRGNRFRIALRNVTAEEGVVTLACEKLRDLGFVNYYGLQRFGTRAETPTYVIGRLLLQGKFKEAIASILEQREGPLEEALRLFASSGPAMALRALPQGGWARAGIELRLLHSLAAQPNDLLGAVNKLARNTRLLYLHSYQSLVWNRCASERLRRFGFKASKGDLVPLSRVTVEDLEERLDEEDEDMDSESNADNDQAEGEDKMADKTKETEKEPLESSIKHSSPKVPVKVLTQEDIDSGKYSIFDIVLPLPGFNIEYPPNIKDYYVELLEKDEMNLEMSHKLKSYTMSGAYRHVVVRPVSCEWTTVRYSEPHCDLLLSDWDEMQGNTLTGVIEDGKYKALLLTMTLPASCYATMALRELLKVDTSGDNQALQNNYHKVKESKKETDDGQKIDEGNENKIEEVEGNENKIGEVEGNENKIGEVEGNENKNEEIQNENESQSENEHSQSDNGVATIKTEESQSGEKRKLESDSEVETKKLKQENQ